MEIAKRLSGVGEYYFSKKLAEVENLRRQGKDIISLGIGSPDLPPSAKVVEALHSECMKPTTHGYANYKGTQELLEATAEWYARKYGVVLDPATEILTLYGSKEGIIFLCQAFISEGDKVLVPNPGYPAYSAAVKLSQGVSMEYTLTEQNGWMPDFEALEKSDLSGVKMMLLNYPHMPTGTLPTKEVFEKFVDFARRHNILLVHDNPYSFIRNSEPMSLLSIDGAKEVAVELNSLSKSHNMAGWRVGFMLGRADVLATVLRYKSNLNNAMFVPLQHAAATALALGDEWYEELNRTYFNRQSIAYQILDTLGCVYDKGQVGLFAWGRLPDNVQDDCYTFIDKILLEKGVFITPGGIFGSAGERYIRISLCANEQTLTKALDRLK